MEDALRDERVPNCVGIVPERKFSVILRVAELFGAIKPTSDVM